MSRPFYSWTRDLHLYFGLWVSPFVLIFSISVILLNHPGIPIGAAASSERRGVTVEIPAGLENADGAERVRMIQQIMRQAGITGEIGIIRNQAKQRRLAVAIWQPGREISLEVNLETHQADVQQRRTGIWDAMNYLHKSPGPHLANLRGNWVFTRVWRWLADTVVYLLLFISASGVYLWTVLRAERRTGLILLGTGALSFMGLIYALTI